MDTLDELGDNIGDAKEFTRLKHSGWYTDNFQDGLVKGAVIAIRTGAKEDEDGAHFQYMPATYHTDWDGATIYNDFYACKSDAAIAADGYAEREAEVCREDDAKYQAEHQIDALKEELHDLNKSTLAVIKEVKSGFQVGQFNAICGLIRKSIKTAVERRTEIFEEIEKLEDNYWLSVE